MSISNCNIYVVEQCKIKAEIASALLFKLRLHPNSPRARRGGQFFLAQTMETKQPRGSVFFISEARYDGWMGYHSHARSACHRTSPTDNDSSAWLDINSNMPLVTSTIPKPPQPLILSVAIPPCNWANILATDHPQIRHSGTPPVQ